MKNIFLKNSFFFLFTISFLISLPIVYTSVWGNKDSAVKDDGGKNTEVVEDVKKDPKNDEEQAKPPQPVKPKDTAVTPPEAKETPQQPQQIPPKTDAEAVTHEFTKVSEDYFKDALFVGDSRTLGISEYGTLKNATFFADSGMSVYNLFDTELEVKNIGKTGLLGLLQKHTYGKVYVMLGINELGYNHNKTVEKYGGVIAKIRELEPDALIFVEANLHVTGEKSQSDKLFNNRNINRLNLDISKLADNKSIFYLDVNPVFDDENGNLIEDYSGDDIHIYGKYYTKWSEWFCTVGIVK